MKVRCPSCKEWAAWEKNSFRPFCSQACKNRDLGKWATESYSIPVETSDPEFDPSTQGTKKEDE